MEKSDRNLVILKAKGQDLIKYYIINNSNLVIHNFKEDFSIFLVNQNLKIRKLKSMN
jgi:hypothetical protein